MITLFHAPFNPHSRAVRLTLAEYGFAFETIEERVWERRVDFLAINPAATVPVIVDEDASGPITIVGASVIYEYLRERYAVELDGRLLFPGNAHDRSEVRRLVDWFDVKFHNEVTLNVVFEKVDRRFMPKEAGGGPPDMSIVHAGLHNLKYHLKYISHLMAQRRWLAGDDLTHADLAAAAHLSTIDYLGHVSWEEFPEAKTWYARLKSRKSFRQLFADSLPGLTPSAHYADLDF